MIRTTLVLLTGALLLAQVGVAQADSDMFRPFEPWIDAENHDRYVGFRWDSVNPERYRVVRERSWFKKQTYFKRHCGSAYINCHYPDQDYPRYNGPVYHLPRR